MMAEDCYLLASAAEEGLDRCFSGPVGEWIRGEVQDFPAEMGLEEEQVLAELEVLLEREGRTV